MLSILMLVKILVISPAKSVIIEFKPSYLKADLDILWKYYLNGGDANVRAYIDIPKATFEVTPLRSTEDVALAFDGSFIDDNTPPHEYNIITAHEGGLLYAYSFIAETTSLETYLIGGDTRLRYNYAREIIKKPPYVAITYASIEEIQKEIDDISQGIDINTKYSQPTYAISYGVEGHFIQYVETTATIAEHDLDIAVLFGSINNDGSVMTITSTTTKPFLLHDIDSEKPFTAIEGAIGVRMANIGVLAKRDNRNKVSLFTVDNLDHRTNFIDISHEDIMYKTSVWRDCFVEDPPSSLEKGFKVVIKGHVFIKRCGYPIDSDNKEVKQHGKKVIIEIDIANACAKFTRYYHNMSRSSSQLFFGEDKKLYMIADNTQLLIDKFVTVRYSF